MKFVNWYNDKYLVRIRDMGINIQPLQKKGRGLIFAVSPSYSSAAPFLPPLIVCLGAAELALWNCSPLLINGNLNLLET